MLVLQRAFDDILHGREPMLLQQLVEVDLGARPPDRYAALVEAAVNRCGGRAERITALPKGVSFVYSVADHRPEVFLEARSRVEEQVRELLKQELAQAPSGGVNVDLSGSTFHGSNVGVGQAVSQTLHARAGDQYLTFVEGVRAAIDGLEGAPEHEKHAARTMLEQAKSGPPAQRKLYWDLLANLTGIAAKLPPEVFHKAAELIGLG